MSRFTAKNQLTQLATLVVVLLALVDGILIGSKLMGTPISDANPKKNLQDYFPELTQEEEQPKETSTEVLGELQESVPFISQAPMWDWKSPWSDYAEEASILMVIQYINGGEALTPRQAANRLLQIGDWEASRFGNSVNASIEQVSIIFRDFFNYKNISILENPDKEALTKALSEGDLILAPINGRVLDNPFYADPAPKHHMLVILSYQEATDSFTVNDPGTNKGEGLSFSSEKILQSLEDLDGLSRVLLVATQP